MIELGEESSDEDTLTEVHQMNERLKSGVEEAEFQRMLSGTHDRNGCFVSVNSGAGGTESQDWANMLLRMLLRYCEKKGWKAVITDYQDGEEAGLKSATFSVSGEFAYGHLKAEAGVHRLVRLSPFDSNNRRHTSFASVFVFPEIEEEDIDIRIADSDLRVDTYRSSGSGGQHVNTTDSAVRITHLPTGTVVACQEERSQIKNRAKAMKVLKTRILDNILQEQNSKMAADRKQQVGSGDRSERIRTYNFPQGRMTDHRIGLTLYRLDSIMAGDIEEITDSLRTFYQMEALKAQSEGN